MSNLSIGIVGLGYWGPNLLRNFSTCPGWTVKYGCDLSEKNLEKMRAQYPSVTYTSDLNVLLNDPTLSAIAVATPTSGHYAIAKAALEAGKHVLIEKPITTTSAEAEELIALAASKGLHILVDHTFVYTGAVRKIEELVKSGDLGTLYYFDSTRINLGLIQKDVNVLWDLAIHDLSILGLVCDLSTLTSVYAHGSKHYGQQEEIGHLHLSFAGGFEAHIHVSWLSPVKLRQTIIGGTKKMVLFDDINPSEKLKIYDTGVEQKTLGETQQSDPFFPVYRSGDVLIPKIDNTEALRLEADHFHKVIDGLEKPKVPGEQGKKIVQILEYANLSLRDKIPLPVSL
jgi:predicted dehydrogenase